MIERIQKSFIAASGLLLVAFALLIVAAPVSAQSLQGSTKCGSNINLQGYDLSTEAGRDARDKDCKVGGNASKLEGVIRTVINVLSAIVGSVSVIMVIIGGFKYVTSSGDSNNVSSAKNTVMYALVGLVIVAFAQIIVQFVLERVL